jgi:hypothetical protein
MVFTREDWVGMKKRAELKRDSERAPYYRGLAQSEVGAKQLTQHSAWNWFLQILTANKEQAEHQLQLMDEKMRSSDDFSHETLARAQASRLAWAERIRTLEEVIALPSQIVDDAKRAKEKLVELNRAESNEKSDSPAAS